MAEHLIPFRGKHYSGPVNQNLLWRDGNVFLMDNHRAALWCWQQEIDLYQTPHSLLHIDRHTDCLGANLDAHMAALPDLRQLTLNEYLDATVALSGGDVPLFRWDNYLSIHLKRFSNQVTAVRCIDHGDGDAPDHPATIRPGADEVPQNVLYWLRRGPAPWIVNVDLDYFYFEAAGEGIRDDTWLPMYSDEFIETVFGEIKNTSDEGLVGVVTIYLTPSNFTPGWDDCLKLSSKIFDILGASHPTL